jgi:tetratricopeptide (TPR) repeat protein
MTQGTTTRRGRAESPLGALSAEGRFAEALALYHEGGDEWFATPDAGHLAATAAARLGRFDEAWALATAALSQFIRRGDRDGQLRSLNLMGAVCFERGHLAPAETAFRSAARLAEDLTDRTAAARAWSNLGILVHLRRHPLQAMDLFLRALALHEDEEDASGMARVHHNLALARRDLGELHRATAHVAQAVHWANQAWDPPLCGLVILGRGELALAYGDLAAAAHDIQEGRELADVAGDGYGLGEADRLLAALRLREGQPAAARDAAVEAIRRATALGAAILAVEAMALHALSLSAMGLDEEAAEEHTALLERLQALDAPRLAHKLEQEWTRRGRRR